MNSPQPTGEGQLTQHLRELRAEVRSIRPQRAAGESMTRTTAGTMRRPLMSGNRRGGGTVARWS